MILGIQKRRRILTIGSKARQAMAVNGTKTPFFIPDNKVITDYECLRLVWLKGENIKNVCSKFAMSRSSFYELEKQFVIHGLVGLFPDFYDKTRNLPDVEDLIIMAKKARPSLSNLALLRILEAIPLTKKYADRELISDILESYGYSVISKDNDRIFWEKFQRILYNLARLKKTTLTGRDVKYRRETFFIDGDYIHKKFELLRELYWAPHKRVRDTCVKFGVSLTSFYRLVDEYFQFGPWAIIPSIFPGNKDSISEETQLQIIMMKLRNPHFSGQQIVDTLNLKCSRYVVNRITARWQLDSNMSPIALDEYLGHCKTQNQDEPKNIIAAIHQYSEDDLLRDRRLNRHFMLIAKKMRTNRYHICDPGPIIMAPFINQLGIVQALELYGPTKLRGKELTNLSLLNIMRIIGGYKCISHLNNNRDRSVALAAGIGIFGSSSRYFEQSLEYKFDQIHRMRLDLLKRAHELGIISGKHIGFDFHFKEFYGTQSEEKNIGKGPDKAGNLVPGFRPHIAWDLAENVICSMTYYQGATRSPRIIRNFCEQNIFPIIAPQALQEIYLDSEYTKEGDIAYFKHVTNENGDVFICLKKNKQIEKLIKPAIDNASVWQSHDSEDEKTFIDTIMPKTGIKIKIVILRNCETKSNIRCFGCTNEHLSTEAILERYRYRWVIENGIKDLVQSYFLDHTPSIDPEKFEFELYCILVARIAFEMFLKELMHGMKEKQDGNKFTLSTMRNILFEKRNSVIEVDSEGNIILTFMDCDINRKNENLLETMFNRLEKKDLNKVLWWGNKKLKLRFFNQYSEIKVSDLNT